MKAVLLALGLSFANAQDQRFEVVSIKISIPTPGAIVGSSGGPGTKKPGSWTCQNMSLRNIVMIAFNVRNDDIIAPAWMDDARFDISAKVPAVLTRGGRRPRSRTVASFQ